MSAETSPFIRATQISKSFSKVTVLQDVDFEIFPGEVHALVGENGAGKSTLVKVICGVHPPDKGVLVVDGKEENIPDPNVARDLGISFIHQEPLIFQDLNVTENIFVGHTRGSQGIFLNWPAMYKKANELLASLDVKLDAKAKTRGMSIADQQMVEIISALSQDAKVIVMDEPTAALTPGEVEHLFKIVNLLKKQGKALVFISHRLDEVLAISDRTTVLRDGEKVVTKMTKDLTKTDIVKYMIGREMTELIVKEKTKIGEKLFSVENLTLKGTFKNVTLDVKAAEIVGVAGLVGAGRSEVAQAIFGITPPDSGDIFIKGKKTTIGCPKDAINHGVAYVPEDRQHQGLFLPFAVARNITYTAPEKISKRGWLKLKNENSIAKNFINQLKIKLRSRKQPIKELSGGNQQKVVLSKWLLTEPQILILDEPTRGIDVGAKEEVYKIINQLAKEGKAILMISSELPEIISLSDRVIVMKEGQITGRFDRSEVTDEKIMTAATVSIKES
jgi:rhamnose transport system ATP-binding protein